ncbi:MAG TPA: hypothetical protein VFE07_12330 [Marmoricola sp.]|jgi:hypothetical protein|nr:hypothetical protein [Marmoricola sp.]
MPGDDQTPPMSDDDFPEFAEPPRHKPPMSELDEPDRDERPADSPQDEVDDVIARLRRERQEGRS